jgi:hypothetical protein
MDLSNILGNNWEFKLLVIFVISYIIMRVYLDYSRVTKREDDRKAASRAYWEKTEGLRIQVEAAENTMHEDAVGGMNTNVVGNVVGNTTADGVTDNTAANQVKANLNSTLYGSKDERKPSFGV